MLPPNMDSRRPKFPHVPLTNWEGDLHRIPADDHPNRMSWRGPNGTLGPFPDEQ